MQLLCRGLRSLTHAPLPQVGDRVECNLACGWSGGAIAKHFYTQQSFPPNKCAPYQIKLDDGSVIYAPADHDSVIRTADSNIRTRIENLEWCKRLEYQE